LVRATDILFFIINFKTTVWGWQKLISNILKTIVDSCFVPENKTLYLHYPPYGNIT